MWSVLIRSDSGQSGHTVVNENIDGRADTLPTAIRPRDSVTYGILCLSRDQRLVLVDDFERGARQIHESIPFGKCLTAWTSDDCRFTSAVLFRESQGRLIVVNVDRNEGTATHHLLPSPNLLHLGNLRELVGATYCQGVIFAIFRTKIEAFDSATYQLLATKPIGERYEWKHGRYFFDSTPVNTKEYGYFRISFDGTAIVAEKVPLGRFASQSLILLFDRAGHDGPFGISKRGMLVDLAEQTESTLWKAPPAEIDVLDVSEDGRRILMTVKQTHSSPLCWTLVHIESMTTNATVPVARLAEVDSVRVSEPPHLMRHFASIAIQGEAIVLVSKRGNPWTFKVQGDRLLLQEMNKSLPTRLSRNFEWISRPPFPRLQAVAKWKDGSRAWLDARGILHLQSSDRAIPEISLVLSPMHVAVWTSDGQTNGSRYFLNTENSISAEEIVTNIFGPFAAQLQ